MLRENKLHLSWKSKKLRYCINLPTNTFNSTALMQHRWRNREREKKHGGIKRSGRFIVKKSAKEPSNLIRSLVCAAILHYLICSHHCSSWLLREEKAKILKRVSYHSLCAEEKSECNGEREHFSRLFAEKNKISIWEKRWKTSTIVRARRRHVKTGMRSFAMHHFLPTWKNSLAQ